MKHNHPDYKKFIETHGYARYAAESTERLNARIEDISAKQVNTDLLCWAVAISLIIFVFKVIFS